MDTESSQRDCVGGIPKASLFAARPWIVLGSVCGLAMSAIDQVGLLVGMGAGVGAGAIDVLWTLFRLGGNQICIGVNEIQFRSRTSRAETIPLKRATSFVVEASSGGALEYFSSAYTTFATVRVLGGKNEIAMLAKTRGQVKRLQTALDDGLERARLRQSQEPK